MKEQLNKAKYGWLKKKFLWVDSEFFFFRVDSIAQATSYFAQARRSKSPTNKDMGGSHVK